MLKSYSHEQFHEKKEDIGSGLTSFRNANQY
jgi:hypothetical protein